MSVVVSVRIPRWVRERLEKADVNIAEFIRETLIKKARELEEEHLRKLLDELAASCRGRVDPLEVARLVEEAREER